MTDVLESGECHIWWADPRLVSDRYLALLDAGERCRYEGCPDRTVPHGRPELRGSGIEVSVAHSADRVAVAATRAGPVGVDVELIDPLLGVDDLMRSVLAPEERKFPSTGTPAGFYRMWTRKEAVLKATGAGLRVPLSDVAVSSPVACPRLVRLAGVPARADDFVLADLEVAAGYAAAAAVMSHTPVRFVARDGGPLIESASF